MKETENWLKPIAEFVTKHLSSTVEILAALVIAVALIKFLFRYLGNLRHRHFEHENQNIRIQFGSSLTIALELLLAADILATAIAPTWDDIGKLAAIATLRTALNYFLERELKESRTKKDPLLNKTDHDNTNDRQA
ncbi:MAG TPA: DUF1622 domain-containing protein [Flavisolibacter sp.]|nr:DUF1622 domain-containing protein [Flavisolibacter sp.]